MKILFQENNYYSKGLNEKELFKEISDKTKFTYGDVTYKKYSEHYKAEGWQGRKWVAIPLAVCCMTAKSVYHIACVLFVGIPTAIMKDSKALKCYAFCIVRDLQEGMGHLLVLFNDKKGLFHVQEAQFQKECYALHMSGPKDYPTAVKEAINRSPAQQFSLDGLTDEEFVQMVPQLNNPATLRAIPESRINKIDYEKITADQFKMLFPVKAPETAEKLGKLSGANLQIALDKFFTKEYYDLLPISSLNKLDYTKVKEEQIKLLFAADDKQLMPKLIALTPENFKLVFAYLRNNPEGYFSLIPDEQLSNIPSEKLTSEALLHLFPTKEEGASVQKGRFGLLSGTQVFTWFDALQPTHKEWITEKQLEHAGLKVKHDAWKCEKDEAKAPPVVPATEAHYASLGLKQGATPEEIKAAYKKLAAQYHPDKAGEAGKEKMQEINVAYQVLKDNLGFN